MIVIKPLVSVIIGAYNAEAVPTFAASMQSIISQSLKELEIIICDDGSKDKTYDLLLEYASKDDRIKLLHNEINKGLGYTLNKCLAVSRGKYIARHDIDDISDTRRLEIEVNFLEKNKDISFVGSNVLLFDENGVYAERKLPEYVRREDFLFNSPFIHGSLLLKRNCLLDVGGYRNVWWTLRNEDYDLWMRLYAKDYKGYNIQKSLYRFLEDKNAAKRRKYRYRINECIVRINGFRNLKMLWKNLHYVIKPLIVGLLPIGLIRYLQHMRERYVIHE